MSADPKIFVSDIVPPTADTHDLKVVVKKGRKPMSQTRKDELKQQLAKAREIKKAKRLADKALKDAAKAEKKEEPKSVEAVVEGTEKVLVKTEPEVVVDTQHLGTPKTVLDQLLELKEELKELKKGGTSKDDMAEIAALKIEMKDLRDAAKAYKESQKNVVIEKVVRKKKVVKEPLEAPAPTPPPAPRYSTYKKSIWTNLM